MPIISGAGRRNIIVDPTRIKGNLRVFKNVQEAVPPPSWRNHPDLMAVYEPGTGYRAVDKGAVQYDEPAADQKQSEATLRKRGWFPSDGQTPAQRMTSFRRRQASE